MREWQCLTHVRWDCKYDVVIIPEYRKRKLCGKPRKRVAEKIRDVCGQRAIEMIGRHFMPASTNMCLSIPLEYSIAFTIGFMKAKSAVRIHRHVLGKSRAGLHFWSCGYFLSKVTLCEEVIKGYIRNQETFEKRQGELEFDT
jgi:putative transposase